MFTVHSGDTTSPHTPEEVGSEQPSLDAGAIVEQSMRVITGLMQVRLRTSQIRYYDCYEQANTGKLVPGNPPQADDSKCANDAPQVEINEISPRNVVVTAGDMAAAAETEGQQQDIAEDLLRKRQKLSHPGGAGADAETSPAARAAHPCPLFLQVMASGSVKS